MPSWADLLAKYDKDGDGFVSKSEFPPTDFAWMRRVESESTPGAVSWVRFEQFDSDRDGKVTKDEWETGVKRLPGPAPATTPTPRGLLAIKLGGAGDMTEKSVLWSERRAVPEVPAPLIFQGRVYGVTNGGILTVIDESSGKMIYRSRLGAGGPYYSSPVVAGGLIYFSSSEGVVTVIRPGDKLEVVSRNDLGEPIFATPAIVDGMLCVRTSSHLYAFGSRSK